MDMLAFIIQADAERGFLAVNGKAATTPQIAKMLGADTRQVARFASRVGGQRVFSRDERGAIFSRRMARTSGNPGNFPRVGSRAAIRNCWKCQ